MSNTTIDTPQKPKKRRFITGTAVFSTDPLKNETYHKFVVRVRYHADFIINGDYFVQKERISILE
jgi:hypothetical protein